VTGYAVVRTTGDIYPFPLDRKGSRRDTVPVRPRFSRPVAHSHDVGRPMSTTLTAPEAAPTTGGGQAPWKATLAPYARPHMGRSLLDLATSVVPYIAGFYAMYLLLDVSYWLVLALSIPVAGFLLRTYIMFHDCAHGNFMPTKRGNHVLGVFLALIVYTPFSAWRHSHAMHHATAGDLDRRGDGDVPTLTVEEYYALPRGARIVYYLTRNPFVMMGIGPIAALVIQPRLWKKTDRPRIKRSVIGTNVALVAIVTGLCLLMGWKEFLLVQAPLVWLAGGAGVWLFYVQHQFEDAYWESADDWTYAEAALKGSSYLKLPKVLQFFSGNIGLHHVHHLSAKVPNYHLQGAHDSSPIFQQVPVLTLGEGMRAMRLKVWSDTCGRLVTWREASELMAARSAATASGD
jgi:omega-6 fatty acid desaturase (delta-12 desaturase)